MKILILQDNAINESIALCDLVGYMENKGHCFELLIEQEEKKFFKTIINSNYDIILIPADIGGHHWAHYISKKLKTLINIPIVIAGVYPTFYPEIVLQDTNFDFLIVGEAEIPFSKLLDSIETNNDTSNIKGVWLNKNNLKIRNGIAETIECLDNIPISKKDIYYKYKFIKNFPLKKFATGRGCFNSCSFCFNPLLKKQYPKSVSYVRRKSVKRVIDEIILIKSSTNLKSVHFSDDIFITNEEWLEQFANEFPKKVGLKFSCNVSIDTLTINSIELLKKAGCRAVAIGIESGNYSLRKDILNKDFSNKDSINKALLLQKKGIIVFTFNMIGLPNESFNNIIETFYLNYLMKSYHVRVSIATPIPGTKLFDTFIKIGYNLNNKSILDLPDFSKIKNRNNFLKIENKHLKLSILLPYFYKYPFLIKNINFFLSSPIIVLLKYLSLFFLLKEKKFFEFDFLSGLRYFYHTGSPYKRSKNFVTLV